MTDHVFVIAECGSCWRFGDDHVANAYRMIEAAKECGADAAKFQWTSDYKLMMARRGASPADEEAYTFVQYPREWLTLLKAKCDAVGIEFMCTVFLPQDVAVIAPLVRRFKVAAKESMDLDLLNAIMVTSPKEKVIVSVSDATGGNTRWGNDVAIPLHCVSEYPCKLENVRLDLVRYKMGLSDHTGHVLTGAVAVGCGAKVLEAHFMLDDTPKDNPDAAGHSHTVASLKEYISNVRVAERML